MNKQIILVSLIFLCALTAVAAQTLTITLPESNSYHRNTIVVTATVTNPSSLYNVTNATFWYRLGSSGAYTFIGSERNDTGGDTTFNFTLDTSALTAGSTYQFNVSVRNHTLGHGDLSTVNTGITLDSGTPTARMTAIPVAGGVQVDCLPSTDAFDSTLRYRFHLVTASTGRVVSSSNLTYGQHRFTSADAQTQGSFRVSCEVFDDNDNVNAAANQTVQVTSSDPSEPVVPSTSPTAPSAQLGGLSLLLLGGIVFFVLALAVIAAVLLSKMK
jgi:hypothetical protein